MVIPVSGAVGTALLRCGALCGGEGGRRQVERGLIRLRRSGDPGVPARRT